MVLRSAAMAAAIATTVIPLYLAIEWLPHPIGSAASTLLLIGALVAWRFHRREA